MRLQHVTLPGLLLCTALLAGCAIPIQQMDVFDVRDGRPQVGEVSTVEVGGQLLTQRHVRLLRGRKIDPPTEVRIMMFPYMVSGLYVRANHGQHYCGRFVNTDLLNRGKVTEMCLTDQEFRDMGAPFHDAEEFAPGASNIQRVVEYGGRSGNTISLHYKEFTELVSGSFIRPAFTQELKFDLNEGMLIGLKGARIEVLETSNIGMRYKILSHFPN